MKLFCTLCSIINQHKVCLTTEKNIEAAHTVTMKEIDTKVVNANVTQENGSYNYATELDWIFPVIVNVTLMVFDFWLLISLIHYGITNKKWSKAKKYSSNVLNNGLIYGSVIGCAITCMIHFVTTLLLLNLGYSNFESGICDQLEDAAYSSYALIHFFVALFLWSRQQAFFANRLLNFNYNKLMKYFSFAIIFIIVAYGIVVVALNSAPKFYISTSMGCVLRPGYEVQVATWLTPIIGVAFYNVVLLGLLSYALFYAQAFQEKKSTANLQQQELKATSCKIITNPSRDDELASTSSECGSKLKSKSSPHRQNYTSNKIRVILKKTLIFAVLSILVDIILQLTVNLAIDRKSHRRLSNMAFDIASFFNLLLVILSFDKYKEIMKSPCTKTVME